MNRKLKWLLSLFLIGCGPLQPVDDDDGPESNSAALTIGPGGTGGGTTTIGGQACSAVCTPQSRCDQPCGFNQSSSCAGYGVCQSCAGGCTSASPCSTACLNNGVLSQCSSAGAACLPCSAATCEYVKCGALCQQPQQMVMTKIGPLPGPRTYQRCDAYGAAVTHDKDSDGLDDDFELRLAKQFLPNLHMQYWSEFQFYGAQQWDQLCASGVECQLPVVVRRAAPLTGPRWGWCATGQCVEIIYGLPYNWDTGDPDAPTSSIGHAHQGDAEFVAVLVAYRRADDESDGVDWGVSSGVALGDPTAWRMIAGFWAAHYGEDSYLLASVDSSRYVFPRNGAAYSGAKLMDVYISEGKHASYPSSSECDNGGWNNSDWCGYPHVLDRTQLQSRLVNVGDEYGGISSPGYVCAGFDRYIASPNSSSADAPLSSPAHDVWSGLPFDPTTTWFSVLGRYSRDWGNDYVTYQTY